MLISVSVPMTTGGPKAFPLPIVAGFVDSNKFGGCWTNLKTEATATIIAATIRKTR